MTQEGSTNADNQPSGESKDASMLALPGPDDGKVTTLDVSTGQSVALDHLGPMVVNVDGTLSRIDNWPEMSELEKKNTMRIIGRRNKQRLEALKKELGDVGA